MLTYYSDQSLFSDTAADTWVNPVNVGGKDGVGAMGRGIAKEFKHLAPTMYRTYMRLCHHHLLKVGKPMLYHNHTPRILLFPTKYEIQEPSRLEWIEEGLQYLASSAERWDIKILALPKLGCGNGGLAWRQVGPLVERYFALHPVQCHVYVEAHDIHYGEYPLEHHRNQITSNDH